MLFENISTVNKGDTMSVVAPRSLLLALPFAALLALSGCSSSVKQSGAERDLPEICRFYDFSKDPAMAEECGIRQTRYKSYKNIPAMRYLISPKDAQLVLDRKSDVVELRLSETLPAPLGRELSRLVDFSDQAKKEHLKNRYIYKELYPSPGNRMRLFKLSIPTTTGQFVDYCFQIPERKTASERQRSYTVNTLESLSCGEFEQLIATYKE